MVALASLGAAASVRSKISPWSTIRDRRAPKRTSVRVEASVESVGDIPCLSTKDRQRVMLRRGCLSGGAEWLTGLAGWQPRRTWWHKHAAPWALWGCPRRVFVRTAGYLWGVQ